MVHRFDWLIFILIVSLHLEYYDLLSLSSCPPVTLWDRRALQVCDKRIQYHCLYDTIDSNAQSYVYKERCFTSPKKYTGKRFVLSGNLDAIDCPPDRFTPSPIWSYTKAGSDCPFVKSHCSEEGQVVVDNGTSETDRTCRCDYSFGYDYVVRPKDPCSCQPFIEDCSCYVHRCPQYGEILSPDYECIKEGMITIKPFVCQKLHVARENKINANIPKTSALRSYREHLEFSSHRKQVAVILVLCLVVLLLVGLCVISRIRITNNRRSQQIQNNFSEAIQHREFYIKHVSGGKFVQPSSGSKWPSNNTRIVLRKKPNPLAQTFYFEPYDNKWGYIVHKLSRKAIHPYWGSLRPFNNKMLVLHRDRHAACLFAIDNERNHIVHKSSRKFIHVFGGYANPSDLTHLTLHDDEHEAMEFVTVSPISTDIQISVYPEPQSSEEENILTKRNNCTSTTVENGTEYIDGKSESLDNKLENKHDCSKTAVKKVPSYNKATQATLEDSVKA